MLEKIENYIRTSKFFPYIFAAFLFILVSLAEINIGMQRNLNHKLDKISEQQEIINIKLHSKVIEQKIENFKRTGNKKIDEEAALVYGLAYEYSINGDKVCYVFELMADRCLFAYSQGLSDCQESAKKI